LKGRLAVAFQFLCPNGHLLESNESQVGQESACPTCDSRFLVPQPDPAASASESADIGERTVAPPPEPGQPFPSINTSDGAMASESALPDLSEGRQQVIHVACPQGHELETPREMIGEEVICPYCDTQFRVRFEDSIEYRREKEEQRERRELQVGRTWMFWAIAVAVAVVLGLTILLAATVSQ
jgi:DNA-directed RNA polymerase subunit RPC12/RpoP